MGLGKCSKSFEVMASFLGMCSRGLHPRKIKIASEKQRLLPPHPGLSSEFPDFEDHSPRPNGPTCRVPRYGGTSTGANPGRLPNCPRLNPGLTYRHILGPPGLFDAFSNKNDDPVGGNSGRYHLPRLYPQTISAR